MTATTSELEMLEREKAAFALLSSSAPSYSAKQLNATATHDQTALLLGATSNISSHTTTTPPSREMSISPANSIGGQDQDSSHESSSSISEDPINENAMERPGQAVVQYRRSSKQKTKQEWPCTIEGCSVILYSKSSRFRHQKLHENPSSQYNCKKCTAKFLMKLDLIDHERRAHMDKDSYVVCDKCERTFSSMSNLNAHREIHERSSVPKHVCSLCNVAYFHRSALHRHQRNDHGHVRSQSYTESETNSSNNRSPEMVKGSPRMPPTFHMHHDSLPAFLPSAASMAATNSSSFPQHRLLHRMPPHEAESLTNPQFSIIPPPSFKQSLVLPPSSHSHQLKPLHTVPHPHARRLSVHAQSIISCSYCGDCDSKDEQSYHQHLGSVHNLNPQRQCIINQCNTIIRSKEEWIAHKDMHPHFY